MTMTAQTTRSLLRTTAGALGVAFILVGVAGFIPGITTDYDQLGWVGPDSHAHLLGIFQVSVLHNVAHLGLGAAGLLLARSEPAARAYLIWGGVVYLALWLYGLIVHEGSTANVVPLNSADDWLHLALGAGMVLLGWLLPGDRVSRSPTVDRAA